MKKLLYTLLAVSLIFSACEEEDATPINNNNNTSLSLEQTKWDVTSIIEENDYGTYTYNLPVSDEEGWDTGLEEIEWTFFNNNGFFVEKYTDGYNNTTYDTLQYTYYENLNTILFENNGWNLNTDDPNGVQVYLIDGYCYPDGKGIQILQFNSNTLTIKMTEGDWSFTLFLSKI